MIGPAFFPLLGALAGVLVVVAGGRWARRLATLIIRTAVVATGDRDAPPSEEII